MATSKQTSSAYRLGIPRGALLDILREHTEPYSRTLALISLRVDADSGGLKSLRDYARIWQWSKAKVEYNISGLLAELTTWGVDLPESHRTATGHLQDSPQDSNRTKSGDSESGSNSHRTVTGHPTGQPQDSYRTLTNQSQSQNTNAASSRDAHARETDPFSKLPSEAEYLAFAKEQSIDVDIARDVYLDRTRKGWTVKGEKIRNWQNDLAYCVNFRKHIAPKNSTNGQHRTTPTGKPQSSYERRLNLTATDVRRSREEWLRSNTDKRDPPVSGDEVKDAEWK